MSAEAYVQVAPDGTGKKIRNIESVIAGSVVEQQVVGDIFNGGEVLTDQTGANAVLTFRFSNLMHMIWVRSDGGIARADPFGGVPTALRGIYCEDGIPQPITVVVQSVNIYAPSGTTVKVWGFSYMTMPALTPSTIFSAGGDPLPRKAAALAVLGTATGRAL